MTAAKEKPIYHGLNIHQRLAKVMEEVTYVQKEKKQGMRYSIVSHDVVTAKVRPVLQKWGINAYPCKGEVEWHHGHELVMANVSQYLRFQNIDDRDDYIDVFCCGQGLDKGDKAAGKGQSYATKYGYLKGLMLETGDDPDYDQDAVFKDDMIERFTGTIEAAQDLNVLHDLRIEIAEHSQMLEKKAPQALQKVRMLYLRKEKQLKSQDETNADSNTDG